jgi:hypothetical protein
MVGVTNGSRARRAIAQHVALGIRAPRRVAGIAILHEFSLRVRAVRVSLRSLLNKMGN